jgi:hypothetical protein
LTASSPVPWQSTSESRAMPNRSSQRAVQVTSARMQAKVCNQWCVCACHRRRRIRSPRFFDSFWGTLFLGYAGMPLLTSSCNESSCWRQTTPTTSLTYHFRKWFVKGALCVALANTLGPIASLKVPRVVDPEQAKIFSYWKLKDVESIKSLIEQGDTSPNDIHGFFGLCLCG